MRKCVYVILLPICLGIVSYAGELVSGEGGGGYIGVES